VASPFENPAVVIDGASPIVIDNALVTEPPTLSVTFSVKLKVPGVVGIPEIRPLLAKLSPPGSGPGDNVQVYGCVPPDAAAFIEYATLTSPFGRAVVVIDGAEAMVIDNTLVADAPTLSVTFSVKFTIPAAVGVPVIAPVLAFKISPAGNGPGDNDQV